MQIPSVLLLHPMSLTVEYNGFPVKKTAIKTTPAMSLKSIVEEACSKFGLDPPAAYGLQ